MRRSLLVFFMILALVPGGLLIQSGCNQSADESASSRSDTLKGKITISGAFALYPLTVKWAEEFQKLHPRVTVNVSAGGAGKGMTDALTGMVDLGMFSKSVSPEEQAKGAWWIAVAKDAVLPTVNKENPVLNILKSKSETLSEIILSAFVQKPIILKNIIIENSEFFNFKFQDLLNLIKQME